MAEEFQRHHHHQIDVNLNVNFPALDSLVLYLLKRENFQPQIDSVAATVTQLTARLLTSSTALQNAITKEQEI